MQKNLVGKTIIELRQFEKTLRSEGAEIIGIYFIKIKDWDINEFIPLLFLTQDEVIVRVGTSHSSIKFSELRIEMKNKYINLKSDEDLEFALVEIDDDLDNLNENYTEAFYKLLTKRIETGIFDPELSALLPSQKESRFSAQNTSMPIAITALTMITIGLTIHRINFTIAFFLLFGGILAGLVAALITISNLIRRT